MNVKTVFAGGVLVAAASVVSVHLTASTPAVAIAATQDQEVARMMAMPRPIDAIDTVWIEDMTWMEVRDAMRAGKTTVIIPTGAVEQNGPYMVTGKHNIVNRATCPAIARKLGNALCAPNVAFVPEGDIDPPTDHMRFPGTISLRQSTFEAVVTDIANSMKTHGFAHVILTGDSGGTQAGLKAVAERLSKEWRGSKSRIHYIPEYYDNPNTKKFVADHIGKAVDEGHHDDPAISMIMMSVDPDYVRIRQRIPKGLTSIDNIPLTPVDQAVEWGRKIVELYADRTVVAIRKSIASDPGRR